MIKDTDIKKLQKLAKLDLSSNDIQSFTTQLTNVIHMIDKLQEVDCIAVKPMRSVYKNMFQRVNEDRVDSIDFSEDILKNIPKSNTRMTQELKYFVVPKVIE